MRILFFVFVALISFSVYGKSDCYVGGSLYQVSVYKNYTEKYEKRLLDLPYVVGVYKVDDTKEGFGFFFGCPVTPNLSFEFGRLDNVKLNVHARPFEGFVTKSTALISKKGFLSIDLLGFLVTQSQHFGFPGATASPIPMSESGDCAQKEHLRFDRKEEKIKFRRFRLKRHDGCRISAMELRFLLANSLRCVWDAKTFEWCDCVGRR
jgi:hypothetical protein